jgi:murein DD-endopeptidase MepM/ murein hydrolase activator NlpD
MDERLAVGPRVFGVYKGKLVSGFNHSRPNAPAQRLHKGWDVVAATGTYIRALGDGVVIRVRDSDSVSGYHQEITVYYESAKTYVLHGHVARGIPLRAGREFRQGDILGAVGTSYDAMGTSPHLHAQCWKTDAGMRNYSADSAIDPQRVEDWYEDGRN